jgi:hypothetical protein
MSEDNNYGHLDWLLKTFVDPLRRSGYHLIRMLIIRTSPSPWM